MEGGDYIRGHEAELLAGFGEERATLRQVDHFRDGYGAAEEHGTGAG